MAQLVLGVAGGVVGGLIGGPTGAQIGFALGSAAGASLTTTRTQGPRLADLRAPQASYGSVVPYIDGGIRTSGVWVWASDKRETATTTDQGKGGPSIENTTYTYDMDALILLSENEIGGVRRIWANGQLIWSASPLSDASSLAASDATNYWSDLRVYTGSATQLPDPTYEAAVGTADAPAYRGRGYVFIEGLNLGGSGQIPVLTFEVFRAGEYDSGLVLAQTEFATLAGGNAWDDLSPNQCPATGHTENVIADAGCVVENATSGDDNYLIYALPTATETAITFEGFTSVMQNPNVSYTRVAALFFSTDAYDAASRYDIGIYGSSMKLVFNTPAFGVAYGGAGDGAAWGLTRKHWSIQITASNVYVHFDGQLVYSQASGVSMVGLPLRISLGGNGYDGYDAARFTIQGFRVSAQAVYGAGNFTPPTSFPPPGVLFNATADTVAGAVGRQCGRAGLNPSEYDVTALSGDIGGYAVTQVSSPRAVLEMLASAYSFTALESGGKLTFRPRGQAAVATVSYDDLGASEGERVEPLPLVRANDVELPAAIVVKFANLSNDYQDGAESTDRLVSAGGSVEAVELAMALTPTEARRIAEVRANDIVNSALRVEGLSLAKISAALEPGDAITVVDADGSTLRLALLRVADSGVVRKIDAAVDEASAVIGEADTDINYVDSTTIARQVGTELALLDIPILRDTDDDAGHYAAAAKASNSGSWPGATLLRGENNASYSSVATYSDRTYIGTAASALGGFSGGTVFDEINALTVAGYGTLESWTRDQILNGAARPLLIGDEVVYYRTATLVSAGQYTISGLLRGRRGTEWAVGAHTMNETVVLLQEQGLRRIQTDAAKVGVEMDFKAVTVGTAADATSPVAFTNTSIGKRPLAPVDARFSKAAGATSVSWKRRTRLGVNFTGASGISVPLGEASEAYEVDILSGSPPTVLATLETSAASADLSAATSTLTLELGLERLIRRTSDSAIVGLETADPSFLAVVTSAGASSSRSEYMGSNVMEIAASSTTAYVAVRQLDGSGAWAWAKLRSVPLSTVSAPLENPPAASQTAGTAGDYGGVAWDGSNPWTVGSLTGYLRKHNASTLAVEASVLVVPPVAPYTEAYLRHVTYGSGRLFTMCAGGPHQGNVYAVDPTGSPTVVWTTNVSGAGLASSTIPLQVVGSTLLVPTDAGWALLNATTGAVIASSSSGEQVTSRAALSSTEFVVRKGSSERNVAHARSTVDGSLLRTVTGIGSGAILGAFEGAIIQERASPAGTYTLGDSDVQPGDVVRIYQVSATYGRGKPLEAIIPSL